MISRKNFPHPGLCQRTAWALGVFLFFVLQCSATEYRLGNSRLTRAWVVEGGSFYTSRIENHLDGKILQPTSQEEFILRFSTDLNAKTPDRFLSSADFKTKLVEQTYQSGIQSVVFKLVGKSINMEVSIRFSLKGESSWMRKSIEVNVTEPGWVLERIDVEAQDIDSAYAPYTASQITAQGPGEWRPGLGQPIYTKSSGAFWGVEFPAAWNQVESDRKIRCGYLYGYELKPDQTFKSHSSVLGVVEDPKFVQEGFFEYIDSVRAHPLRLQTQYNTWFDYGPGVNQEKFIRSVKEIHHQLVEERSAHPLRAYVIDDGWQDTRDWTDSVWKVNGKFDSDFQDARSAVRESQSRLGVWLSPGSLFGASSAIPAMREAGMESIDPWMSMAGPKYMGLLQKRLVDLTKSGTGYFKLDGVFGHLNTRNFEVHGDRYGIPTLSSILPEDIRGSDPRLNDPIYDEQKVYYLSAGTERLMTMFSAMRQVNPEVYIVISNGAWLSPWWLSYVDAVWMINAGDAAGGSSRTEELVYRDGVYRELVEQDQTQYPLNSIFNHEPKKTSSKETKDQFRKYLYMNVSRGTGFIELYIKTFALEQYDWDVLAEGLIWAEKMFPTFEHVKMHGGNPRNHEVYGYTGWSRNGELGFVSIHNPSEKKTSYRFRLSRDFGLSRNAAQPNNKFLFSSPLLESLKQIPDQIEVGSELNVELDPGEIRILCLSKNTLDWCELKSLQTRTPSDYSAPKPIPVTNHPLLGAWGYTVNGATYTREFTSDGYCTLKAGDAVQWRKLFRAVSEKELLVEESYAHVLGEDGILRIEGRYEARRIQ